MLVQKAAAALRQLEQQKTAAQRDLEPLLSMDPRGPVSSVLPEKLNQAKNKTNSLNALNDLYTKKYVLMHSYTPNCWIRVARPIIYILLLQG